MSVRGKEKDRQWVEVSSGRRHGIRAFAVYTSTGSEREHERAQCMMSTKKKPQGLDVWHDGKRRQ